MQATTRLAHARALTRSATDEEQKLATEMLRRHRGEHAKKHGPSEASRRALIDLCRAVCNLSEFAYVDFRADDRERLASAKIINEHH